MFSYLRWWKFNGKLAKPFPKSFRFFVELAKFSSIVLKDSLVVQSERRWFNNKTNLNYNKIKYKFLVCLHGEYNILVKLCGNTT